MEARFGTVRTLPSGKFQARYIHPATGQQTTAGTHISAEVAWAKLAEIQATIRHGVYWDDTKSRTLFSDFMTTFMEQRRTEVTDGEFRSNVSALRHHLTPAFGHLRMDQLTVQVIDQWYASQPPRRIRQTSYTFLRRAMRVAVRWEYLKASPCQVELRRQDRQAKRPTFTVEHFHAVLEHADERYRPALLVLLSSHARLGELIALDWSDYDRRTGIVTIDKQVDHYGVTRATKTLDTRRIRLLEPGIEALASMVPGIGNTPLFTGKDGHRLYRGVLRRVWARARADAGRPEFHLHDVRGVGLSLLSEAGVPLRDVMARGGHRSLEAVQVYQHTTSERDVAAADTTSALMKRKLG